MNAILAQHEALLSCVLMSHNLCPCTEQNMPVVSVTKELVHLLGLRFKICIFVDAYLFNMTTCFYTLTNQLASNLLEGSSVTNLYQFVLSPLTLNTFDT